MFEFQQLEVYKKAKSFHIKSKEIISTKRLELCAKDQLSRASFSIVLNIAEVSGKFSRPDRKNYFTTARASLFEGVAILDIFQSTTILSNEDYPVVLAEAEELSKMLFAMIKYLSLSFFSGILVEYFLKPLLFYFGACHKSSFFIFA
jgi:four helix bundle protein